MTDEELRELVRREQAKYVREWRKKNPDKVRAINARYWAKRALRNAETKEEDKNGND